jgi:biopolymer transport protein ExbB
MGIKTKLLLVLMAGSLLASPAAAETADEELRATVNRVSETVLAAKWGLAPLGLASAGLITLTLSRWLAYRRRRLFPRPLRDALDLVATGMHADREQLSRLALKYPSLLANALRTILRSAGRPLADRCRLAEEAIAVGLADLKRATGWFDVLYSTSTLIGLLGAVVGLIDAFTKVASMAGDGKGPLNAAIASALVATGMGVVIAILARILGEAFRHKHQRVATELARRLQPLVLDLDAPGSAGQDAAIVPPPSTSLNGVSRHNAPVDGTNEKQPARKASLRQFVSAIAATALGILVAMMARASGQKVRPRDQRLAIELAHRMLPLVLDAETPRQDTQTALGKPSVNGSSRNGEEVAARQGS